MNKLKAARKVRGMKAAELAKKMGIQYQTLRLIECGLRSLTEEKAALAARLTC